MESFQKVTAPAIKLTGRQKAAILSNALSPSAFKNVAKFLNDEELAALSRAAQSTGITYSIEKENSVLEQTCNVGARRGFIKLTTLQRIQDEYEQGKAQASAGIAGVTAKDTDKIAQVLSMWLKED